MGVTSTDSKIYVKNEFQELTSWAAFNSIFIEGNRSKQRVGFAPVLPHAITRKSDCLFISA